jgi:hypothetical protein
MSVDTPTIALEVLETMLIRTRSDAWSRPVGWAMVSVAHVEDAT